MHDASLIDARTIHENRFKHEPKHDVYFSLSILIHETSRLLWTSKFVWASKWCDCWRCFVIVVVVFVAVVFETFCYHLKSSTATRLEYIYVCLSIRNRSVA